MHYGKPTEGTWSSMKNSLGNLDSYSTPRQLAAIMKNRLKRIQYRPGLIEGFLAQGGLSPSPNPNRHRTRPQPFKLCNHSQRDYRCSQLIRTRTVSLGI